MTNRAFDDGIFGLARKQHGVFSRSQVVGLGGTSGMVRRRLAAGQWVRLAPGVFAVAGSLGTWHRQLKAAELSITGAVVSGRAAAALHELSDFRPGRPEITVPLGSSSRSPLAVVRRRDPIAATRRHGIRVVTVEQSIADLAADLGADRLRVVVEDALRDRKLDLEALQRHYVATARRGRPGQARLRTLLVDFDGDQAPTESRLEAVLHRVLARVRGLPRWQAQHGVPWWTSGAHRVDVLIGAWRLVIEADGRRWHLREHEFERDRWRDNQAMAHGYRVLRFTWRMLTQAPDQVVRVIEEVGRRGLRGVG